MTVIVTVSLVTSSPYNGRVLGAGQAMIVDGGFAFHFPKGFASVQITITDNHGVLGATREDVCGVVNGCRPPR